MKFLKTRKYRILSNILKYSFVAVFAVTLFVSATFKNIVNADGEILKVSNVSNSSAEITASGLKKGIVYSVVYSNGTFITAPIYQNSYGTANTTLINLPAGPYSISLSYIENGRTFTGVAATSFQIENNYALPPPNTSSYEVSLSDSNMVGTSVVMTLFGLDTIKTPVSSIDIYLSSKDDASYINTKSIDPASEFGGAKEVTFDGLKNGVLYSGEAKIVLKSGEVINRTDNFIYGKDIKAVITSISPMQGNVGDMVTITGDNFLGVSKISFGSGSTVSTTNNRNEITVKVPSGATSNTVTVTTIGYGTATSADVFLVNSTGTPVDTSVPATASSDPSISTKTAIVWHGLVPECSRTGDKINTVTGNYSHPCDFNVLIGLINRLISFVLVDLALPLFALIIIYVAWLFLSAGGSSENVTKAKHIFKNVVIGYIIALAAWLIVKTILSTLGFTGDSYLS